MEEKYVTNGVDDFIAFKYGKVTLQERTRLKREISKLLKNYYSEVMQDILVNPFGFRSVVLGKFFIAGYKNGETLAKAPLEAENKYELDNKQLKQFEYKRVFRKTTGNVKYLICHAQRINNVLEITNVPYYFSALRKNKFALVTKILNLEHTDFVVHSTYTDIVTSVMTKSELLKPKKEKFKKPKLLAKPPRYNYEENYFND